jgi:hypothetical protein
MSATWDKILGPEKYGRGFRPVSACGLALSQQEWGKDDLKGWQGARNAGNDYTHCQNFFLIPPHPTPLPPLGGEGIRGKNFWQTLYVPDKDNFQTLSIRKSGSTRAFCSQLGPQAQAFQMKYFAEKERSMDYTESPAKQYLPIVY